MTLITERPGTGCLVDIRLCSLGASSRGLGAERMQHSVCTRLAHHAMVRDDLLDWTGDNVNHKQHKNQKFWF
jgi:hypothetical protein